MRAEAVTRKSGEMGNLPRRPKTRSPRFWWCKKGRCSITLLEAGVTWGTLLPGGDRIKLSVTQKGLLGGYLSHFRGLIDDKGLPIPKRRCIVL
jgi:hypothetical protein